ncbi:MAG: cob(I)yrinic acid a,c-diamide adenosyltransferase [Desulfatibacillaceae bacterium]|nr:cob(I)yrinic acid a,c-diamide adenosyltransferase [Desulfatibacillaceae bacterium]
MSIYTRNGDCGETSLFSGEKVSKNNARVEAYGDVDELVSCLGMVRALAANYETDLELKGVQQDLMTISAWLATDCKSPQRKHLAPVNPGRVNALEKRIDEMDKTLPRLKGFVLPGGSPASACAHVARTVCRRAERKISGLYASLEPQPPEAGPILAYINRLSDFLFVLARSLNHAEGIGE